jgi:hypothetical protein
MRRALHRKIAQLTTIWLVLATCVGEGWHLLPGSGHWVQVSPRCSVYLGLLRTAAAAVPSVPGSALAWSGKQRPVQPIGDAADCAICRLLAQAGCQATGAAVSQCQVPVPGVVPRIHVPVVPALRRPFQPRAPPVV